jgi:hypothetical protein
LLLGRNDLHPLFKGLPLPEHDEKVVLTDFIKGLNLIEPLLDRDKLDRFRVDKFADALATKSVVILNVILYYFGVGHNFHIIMVILVLTNHVDELISCQLLLSDHPEKGSNLAVISRLLGWGLLEWG